jgi:RHS repeat-associated protein
MSSPKTEHFSDNDAWHWTPEQSVAAVHVDLTYDAAGRVIRVDMPDGTLSRVEHHPWHQRVWDANDTVLDSDWYINALDASHTPTTDTPGFNLLRLLGSPVTGEEDAAWVHPLRRAALKTRLHAGTASTVYLDVLGRPVISDAWNATPVSTSTDDLNSAEPAPANPPARTEEVYREWVEIDRRGRVTALHDARGITCATYAYDDIGRVIQQTGTDDGTRHILVDAEGKPARTGRGEADGSGVVPFVSRSVYDVLQRPVRTYLSIDGATETLHAWVRYGEEKTDAADTLHLGRAWLTFDTGGMMSVGAYELHGAVSAGEQRLVADHTTDPDWSAVLAAVDAPGTAYDDAVDLLVESTAWTSSGTYDALGRPVTATKPDGSILRHEYDAGGALLGHYVRIRGAATETTVFEGQRYNARGQRTRQVTPGSVRTWSYDPDNFRLNTLKAVRTSDGEILQDLRYTYDPTGNVMEVRDRAQQAVFFDNDVVLPSLRHAYDAAYRLIRSEGREHASLGAYPHPSSSSIAMERVAAWRPPLEYHSCWSKAPANTALAWTRDFVYDSDTNRVTSVGIDSVGSATVTHDDFGQMTALPNIHALNWDASGRLRGSQRVSGATADRVWYVYDGGGQRVRKISETWDAGASEWRPLASTTYVGGIDVVRAFVGGVLDEERETLHCSDGSSGSGGGGRMLLVETRTVDAGVAVSSPVPLMRFQFDNHLGSACLETTEDGSVISYEEFHPYGTCAYSSGTATLDANPKRYRYSGKERDTESGLYYYGARYLAPWLGRWVSPDPSGFVDGVNLYQMCSGNPTSKLDPDGRDPYHNLAFDIVEDGVGPTITPNPVDLGPDAPTEGAGFHERDDSAPSTADQPQTAPEDRPAEYYYGLAGDVAETLETIPQVAEGAIRGNYVEEPTVAHQVGQYAAYYSPFRYFAEARDVLHGVQTFSENPSVESWANSITAGPDHGGLLETGLRLRGGRGGRGGRGPGQQGKAGVNRFEEDLEAAGGSVLGREVTVDAGGVTTRPDLYVQLPNGQRAFVEVKTGPTARLTDNQSTAFPHIRETGGIPRGRRAEEAGLTPGERMVQTPVWELYFQWPLPERLE